jgi:hypothetical protein
VDLLSAVPDWDQPARLIVKTSLTLGDGGGFSGPTKAEGALSDVVAAYRELRQQDRLRARLIIRGGFHLDGEEIDALDGGDRCA